MDDEQMLNKKQLKDRGWTDAQIELFSPEPDATKPNYWGPAPIKLYRISRIERVEASEEFIAAKANADRRRSIGRQTSERKRQELKERVESLEIEVPVTSMERLVELACDSYNAQHTDWYANPQSADEEFLHRIMVNYLRHECTHYEDRLEEVRGKIGADDARRAIKEKVLDAIADAYPELAHECQRQLNCMWQDQFDRL